MTENKENLPEKSAGTAIKKQASETVDLVLAKVKNFVNDGDLHLPANYSAPNALKAAWLKIQKTVDKTKRPALDVCTKQSIANCLLDMVVQGLDPIKNQCYFIVRGNQLCLDRGYFGSKAVCLRVDQSLDDVYAEVVYKGDKLEYSLIKGKRVIEEHRQKLENIDDDNIIAAYAVAIDKQGNVKRSELMTMQEIKQAWKQSPMHPIDENGEIKPNSTHGKFKSMMARKTVTNRLCNQIINTSNNSDLLIQTIRRNDDMNAELIADQEAEEFANQDLIDITPEPETEEDENADQQPQEQGQEPEQQNIGPSF